MIEVTKDVCPHNRHVSVVFREGTEVIKKLLIIGDMKYVKGAIKEALRQLKERKEVL